MTAFDPKIPWGVDSAPLRFRQSEVVEPTHSQEAIDVVARSSRPGAERYPH
jgi:hypothetical protein